MKRGLLFGLALAAFAGAAAAQGATSVFTITINSPPSTSVTLTAVAPCSLAGNAFSCTGGLAAGATIATIAVAPSGWTGGITIGTFTGGANSSSFAISGASPSYNLTAGAAGLPVGFSGGATLTATP